MEDEVLVDLVAVCGELSVDVRQYRALTDEALIRILQRLLRNVYDGTPGTNKIQAKLSSRWPKWKQRWRLPLEVLDSLDHSVQKRSVMVLLELLALDVVTVTGDSRKSEMPMTVYQFKISLLDIKPEIWRRIQVPAEFTFWDLHVAIQDAMGWFDKHLHAFHIKDEIEGDVEIGIPDGVRGGGVLPSWEIQLEEFFIDVGEEVLYIYDFGDDWVHRLLLEGVLLGDGKKYPRLLGGKRACPPEDCGGLPGYQELVMAMKDKRSEGYESMVEWLGGVYDPGKFKKSEVSFDDPQERFKQAFGK